MRIGTSIPSFICTGPKLSPHLVHAKSRQKFAKCLRGRSYPGGSMGSIHVHLFHLAHTNFKT